MNAIKIVKKQRAINEKSKHFAEKMLSFFQRFDLTLKKKFCEIECNFII